MADRPVVNFNFKVEWGGTRIGFQEVSGLKMENEVLEYREGSSKDYSTTKIPGLTKYSNITLKRGIFLGDNELYDWWKTVHDSEFRKDIIISQLNGSFEPIIVYKIRSAWPVKFESSNLNAIHSGIAIESLEITHEGILIEHF